MNKYLVLTFLVLATSLAFAKESDPVGHKSLENIAFHRQGENLALRCEKIKTRVRYGTTDLFSRAKNSVVASLQLIGLKLTASAIVDYVKLLEYDQEQSKSLYDNLVKNDCSKNVTVLSTRGIRKLFDIDQSKNKIDSIPSLEKSFVFGDSVKNILESRQARVNEFKSTVENFKAFCSWSNVDDSYRLMAPYIANKYIMSFLFNQLTQKRIVWNSQYNEVRVFKSQSTTRVACKSLLCREKSEVNFKNDFPRMLGSNQLEDDLEALYCSEFRNLVLTKTKIKKLDKTILEKKEGTVQAELMNFVSLITKTPDILNAVDNSKELLSLFNENVLSFWDRWAKKEIAKNSHELLFEEALNVDLVSQRELLKASNGLFNLKFRYTLGEYDRMLGSTDKIDVNFSLEFPAKYLAWFKREYISLFQKGDHEGVSNLKKDFEKRVAIKLSKKGSFFLTNLWNNSMSSIIVEELAGQILDFRGNLDKRVGTSVVPVNLEFGIFALKFIREKYQANFIKESLTAKN